MLAGFVAGGASCDGSGGRQAKGPGGQLRCQLQRLPNIRGGTRKAVGGGGDARAKAKERGAALRPSWWFELDRRLALGRQA